MVDLFEQLNSAQGDAVKYIDGPSLVIAGAGAGKTRVLTYKIAYLLQNGYKPWNILALTFTNKAANEMKERIAVLVGEEMARKLVMGTFHSVFSRILRIESEAIGFPSDYTIYDETDSCSLLKSIIKEMDLSDKLYKPSLVHKYISLAKNHICMPEEYAVDGEYRTRDEKEGLSEIYKIYEVYNQRLKQANAMDFDDILLQTHLLFHNNPKIRRKYAEKYQFILVDEYQDTNTVQQDIVHCLASLNGKVCAVGDDAQSIYAFRGANIKNVLDFEATFSTAENSVKLFKLEQNYRSTQNIVNAANSLIHKNVHQIKKDVYSKNDEGEKIRVRACYSDREEAIVVANDIKRRKRTDDMKFSDFAILYRTNVQSRMFEEQLRKEMMAYKIVGGLSFYQHKEIKDILAYIRLIINHNDEEALKRIINYPTRGIGKTTLDKVYALALEHQVSPWQIVAMPTVHNLQVSRATMTKLIDFANTIDAFSKKLFEVDAFSILKEILVEFKINEDIFGKNDIEDIKRQDNVQELLNGVSEFVVSKKEESGEEDIYLKNYLQEIALMTDLDSEGDTDDRITLMTVHAAKGLEFPAVYVVGMDENIFPSERSINIPSALEEERRLLYVAITRAKKFCMLTSADKRSKYGELVNYKKSRFIGEIDRKYLDIEYTGSQKNTKNDDFFESSYGSSIYGNRNNSYRKKSDYYGSEKPFRSHESSRSSDFTDYANSYRSASNRQYPSVSSRLRKIIPDVSTSNNSASSSSSASGVPSSMSGSSHDYKGLTVGCMIEHERFGKGTVELLEGSGESSKATVVFQNGTKRQLLLKFAKLKKI